MRTNLAAYSRIRVLRNLGGGCDNLGRLSEAGQPFADFQAWIEIDGRAWGNSRLRGRALVDVNGDGKKDIVVVDQTARHLVLRIRTWKSCTRSSPAMTKPDNVCIAAYDIDRDGQIDFALGAEWKLLHRSGRHPAMAQNAAAKTIDDLRSVHSDRHASRPSIASASPTSTASGKKALISVSLLAAAALPTKETTGSTAPRRDDIAYRIPKRPGRRLAGCRTVLDQFEACTSAHNFQPDPFAEPKGPRSPLLRAATKVSRLAVGCSSGDMEESAPWLPLATRMHPERQARAPARSTQGKLKNGTVHRHHRAVAWQSSRRL